jgi:hypothetical protein
MTTSRGTRSPFDTSGGTGKGNRECPDLSFGVRYRNTNERSAYDIPKIDCYRRVNMTVNCRVILSVAGH